MSPKPPTQRRPPEPTDSSGLRWRPDEDDDDLFPDELPLDSDEAFEDALERALARNGLDRPSGARPQGNSVPPLGGLGEADDAPLGRPSGSRGGSHIERLAREVAEDRASGGTALLDEALEGNPLPSPPRRRPHTWRRILLAGVAASLVLAAILGAWRLSVRLDQIEARLATPLPQSNGTAKVPATGGAPPQPLGSSVREEFRALTEQLRAQVTQDTLRLQGDVRDLAMRSEQRWQALEARRVASQPAPARTPAPAASEVVANGAPPPSPGGPKPLAPQTSKPLPAKPAAGPWTIALASLPDPAQAAQELARLRALGLAVESHKVQTDGKTWHRISLDGFPTREAAEAYVTKAKGNPKLARSFADSRISKR